MRTLEEYQFSEKIQKIGNEAVRKAKEEAQKAGLPIAYSLNGRLVFQLTDGSVTDDVEKVDKIYEEIRKKLQNGTTRKCE
ncbi:MAG: hypothetical protein FWG98_01295 [Candidatus Cloacimonetes bacterium]|nr:hypothetical protein [Candidatus Cloacimonadota bacterium]